MSFKPLSPNPQSQIYYGENLTRAITYLTGGQLLLSRSRLETSEYTCGHISFSSWRRDWRSTFTTNTTWAVVALVSINSILSVFRTKERVGVT
mmetsp:Transcript_92080/g.134574  ORF Transcript_92080/g.134574 Transcript_92080/m.134574 type:complete len:93 (-) Transcript_92080:429-707(-)